MNPYSDGEADVFLKTWVGLEVDITPDYMKVGSKIMVGVGIGVTPDHSCWENNKTELNTSETSEVRADS